MRDRKEKIILIAMALIIVCLFVMSLFYPHSTNVDYLCGTSPFVHIG